MQSKRESRKYLGILLVFAFFAIMSTMVVVMADPAPASPSATLNAGPNPSTWYGEILVNLFGKTWAEVISSLFVLLIITFGVYDILYGFSLFSNTWVMMVIALGLGVIGAMSGAVMAISLFFFKLGAGLGAFAVLVGVGVPLIGFIVLNFLFFNFIKKLKTHQREADINEGGNLVGAAAEALGKVGAGIRKGGKAANE